MYNYDLGPVKALIGWVRFVLVDGASNHLRVEKMSYDDIEINLNPDVIIDATSEPSGIELYEERIQSDPANGVEGGIYWVIKVGDSIYGRYGYDKVRRQHAWPQAKRAVTEMSILQWMALAV